MVQIKLSVAFVLAAVAIAPVVALPAGVTPQTRLVLYGLRRLESCTDTGNANIKELVNDSHQPKHIEEDTHHTNANPGSKESHPHHTGKTHTVKSKTHPHHKDNKPASEEV